MPGHRTHAPTGGLGDEDPTGRVDRDALGRRQRDRGRRAGRGARGGRTTAEHVAEGGADDLAHAVAAGVDDEHCARAVDLDVVRRRQRHGGRRAGRVAGASSRRRRRRSCRWLPTTLRTQLRPLSAMYTVPALSTSMPRGVSRLTAVAAPVELQVVVAPPPATRVTLPAVSTLRMHAAPVSAMKTLPAASTATSDGAVEPEARHRTGVGAGARRRTAGEGRDDAGRGDAADAVVGGVGDVEVARRREGHAPGPVQLGRGGGPSVAGEAGGAGAGRGA